uniref:Uncharacterized protein n=1 Tax=Vitis vinifera TaxID=29760 RepID=A5BXU1_VITVI|nr:hypothetical protein VITISV_015196 [Vitis vinifera]
MAPPLVSTECHHKPYSHYFPLGPSPIFHHTHCPSSHSHFHYLTYPPLPFSHYLRLLLRLARGKLVHLNGRKSFALPSVGPGEFGDLDIKYLKQNISKCRSHISGSFRRTLRHCVKWLRNSPSKRYQKIRVCLTREVETPSFPIRHQTPDVKYSKKVERQPDKIPDVRYSEKMERRKGDRLHVHGVGTLPPDDTDRASLSGATPSEFPKRTRGALPYPDSLKEKHPTLAIITPRMIAYPIWICCPDH